MLKETLIVLGGVTLAVSLPLAALAFSTGDEAEVSAASDTAYAATAQNQDPQAPVASAQPMTRRQLRIHADTGPPEGFEPIQQRLHQDQQMRTQVPGYRMNPDAPMVGAGTGECVHDGECQADGACALSGEQLGRGQMGRNGANSQRGVANG